MIKENISRVRECIPSQITIVAVSKGRTCEQIKEVIAAGITDIGENRVQEAIIKYNELLTHGLSNSRTIKWHMVGHLQTNKVKEAVRIFDLIQSVDSLHLAAEIDKQAARINKVQDILIEVNPVRSNSPKANAAPSVRTSNGVKTSSEATKFGIRADETIEFIQELLRFKNINIKGLMTIAPIVDNSEKTRSYFRKLKELYEEINSLQLTAYRLQLLSMGMTDDFQVAIEEGSNMIRLGRAIFEGVIKG